MKSLITALILLLTASAFGATSATLILKGTVPSILSISVAPETIATSLPLQTTQSNTKVATVTERSNAPAGYKVSIVSANQGKLQKNSSNYVVYSLTYNGSSVNLTGTTQFNNAFTNAAPVYRDVRISYTGIPQEDMSAGDYTDTLTFTITAN